MKPSKILLLRAEIESDLADLEKVVSEIAGLLMDIGSEEPSYRDKAAIGALLHSFYNGIESILKRIAVEEAESVLEKFRYDIESFFTAISES